MREELNEFDPYKIIEIDKDPLKRESDRGCVLICASDIENTLNTLLMEWFKNSSKLSSKEKKTIFDYTGPLGTFSSKIYLSKAIGLLDSNLHSDIQGIRTIRNMAAHSDGTFSLSNPDVKKIVRSMHFNYHKTNRLERYSLVPEKAEQNDKLNQDDMNESIMKGYGLLRADKIDFVLTVLQIQVELSTLKIISGLLGASVRHIRNRELEKIKNALTKSDSTKDENLDLTGKEDGSA